MRQKRVSNTYRNFFYFYTRTVENGFRLTTIILMKQASLRPYRNFRFFLSTETRFPSPHTFHFAVFVSLIIIACPTRLFRAPSPPHPIPTSKRRCECEWKQVFLVRLFDRHRDEWREKKSAQKKRMCSTDMVRSLHGFPRKEEL